MMAGAIDGHDLGKHFLSLVSLLTYLLPQVSSIDFPRIDIVMNIHIALATSDVIPLLTPGFDVVFWQEFTR